MRSNMGGYGGGPPGYQQHFNHMQHMLGAQMQQIPSYGGHHGQQPPRLHPQQHNNMNKHGQKRGRSWEDLQSRPTSVLFLRNVQETSDDRILAQLCAPFGAITQCLHMLEKRSAFVQFERFEDAQRCLEHYQNHPPKLFGRVVKFAWSGREKIKMPDIPFPKSNPPSQVLHLQISLIKHSVSLQMCKQLMGDGLQKVSIREPLCGEGSIIVLAQMCDVETAKDTQSRLEGKYIYSGCNRIAATYSHLSQLDIPCNSSWAHDFLRQPDLNGEDTRSLYYKQQQQWQTSVAPVALRPTGSNTPPIPNRENTTAQLYQNHNNGGRPSYVPTASPVDLEGGSPFPTWGSSPIEMFSSPSPSPEPAVLDNKQRRITIAAIAENPIEYSVPPPSVAAAQQMQAPPSMVPNPHDAPLLSYQPPAKQMYRGPGPADVPRPSFPADQIPMGAHPPMGSPGPMPGMPPSRAASGLGAPSAHDMPPTQQVMINPEGPSVCLLQGLPEHVTPAELATLFAVYGNVVAVKILAHQPSVGLVQLQTEEQSRAAIKHLNGIRVHGLSVRVEPAKGKDLPPMRPDADPRYNLFVSNNREYTRHPMDKPLRSFPPSTNLFIMNLPVKVSESDIRDRIMQLCGLLPLELSFSMDKKACNAHFSTIDEAVTCLTKCGVKDLLGRAMRIGFGVPKRSNASPASGGISPPPMSSASPIITKQPPAGSPAAYHDYSFTATNRSPSDHTNTSINAISSFGNAVATPSTTASGSVLGALPNNSAPVTPVHPMGTPINFGMSMNSQKEILTTAPSLSKERPIITSTAAAPASNTATVSIPLHENPTSSVAAPNAYSSNNNSNLEKPKGSGRYDMKSALAPNQYDMKHDAVNSPTKHRRASFLGRMNPNHNANSNNPAGLLPGLTEKSQKILQDSAFADISDQESVCSE